MPRNSALCILIAEISSDEGLHKKLGAEEAQRAIDRCLARAARSVEAYEGRTLTSKGRRLTACFATCEKGLLAAQDLRERVAQLPPVSGFVLSVRIGVHAEQDTQEPSVVALGVAEDLLTTCAAGQVLVTGEVQMYLSDVMRTNIGEQSDISLFSQGQDLPLYELPPGTLRLTQVSGPDTVPAPPTPLPSAIPPRQRTVDDAKLRLMLSYGSSSFIVNESHPTLLIGREEGNDVVINDRRASRQHARVEWRSGACVVVDTSTNGTFILDEQGNEVVLKQGERVLPPAGRLGLGFSSHESGVISVYFDMGPR